ncbi:MAG TPA: ABC transporter substrate-binding protein [Xanthobacteraceae bacterium]|jgi:iron(III) transport system substrate-binding protein|nr:ABC transporter substrate-binding protein [Xanthobacteraceae bacterium]
MTLRRQAGMLMACVGLSVALVTAAAAQDKVDLAAAKKEGKVVWYTSTPIKTANKLVQMFEAKTGVKVELFRSGGSAILSRFMQELQAKRIACDLLTTSDPAAAGDMARKGILVPFKPDGFDKLPEPARDADGNWVAQRLNMMTLFVRDDKLKEADAPKAWTDATNPKFKGKMVMSDPSFTSLQLMVVSTLSRKLGWKYYEDVRKNDVMIVKGNEQLVDNLKSGERLIALGGLDSYAASARKDGHPIATVYPTDGTFIIPSPTAVIKGSPHPNAAKLLAEFMISPEAQKLFPVDGGYAARTDVDPPKGNPKLADVKSIPIDYVQVGKDSATVKRKFNEIFQ